MPGSSIQRILVRLYEYRSSRMHASPSAGSENRDSEQQRGNEEARQNENRQVHSGRVATRNQHELRSLQHSNCDSRFKKDQRTFVCGNSRLAAPFSLTMTSAAAARDLACTTSALNPCIQGNTSNGEHTFNESQSSAHMVSSKQKKTHLSNQTSNLVCQHTRRGCPPPT